MMYKISCHITLLVIADRREALTNIEPITSF